MILAKLQGYNIATGEYLVQGADNLLPKEAIIVASALPSGYEDISSSPVYWDHFGPSLIGTTPGFKDYMSLRAIILPLITAICGSDFSNFNYLSTDEKEIALRYFPTKIIASQGINFFFTKASSQEKGLFYIDNYLAVSSVAREKRYTAYINFGYQYLGSIQGIKAESYLREAFLDITYVKRGVLYIAEDGIEGLGNWTISDNGFSTDGLKARIDSGQFILGPGITTAAFIDTLQGILDNGTY